MQSFSWRMAAVLVTASMVAVGGPASAQVCAPAQECGDINDTASVTVADALGILQHAIGLEVDLQCSCEGGVTCDQSIVVATGQTMCWDPLDTVSPVDPIDCPATGQDGETQRGLTPGYVDNGDGTITDQNTGLMWEKLSDDGSIHDWDNFAYQWAGAFGKIEDLNELRFANYDDWRLPHARELFTLIDFSAYNPAVSPVFNDECKAGCTVNECSCTRSSIYWSSTTYQNSPTSAWSFTFQTGVLTATEKKTDLNYVRAVRGGYDE